MSRLVIEDDGMPEVELNGVVRPVDVYRTHFLLLDAFDRVEEEFPGEHNHSMREIKYVDRVRAIVVDIFGEIAVSDGALIQFDRAIARAVKELGKAPASAPTPA